MVRGKGKNVKSFRGNGWKMKKIEDHTQMSDLEVSGIKLCDIAQLQQNRRPHDTSQGLQFYNRFTFTTNS